MAPKPSPPSNVKAKGGDETFTVTWSAPYTGGTGLTIDHYRVQKREAAAGLFGEWIPTEGGDDINGYGKKVAGDMTTITFEDLKNGVTYQARVQAVNSGGGRSEYSIRDGDTSTPGDEAAMVGDDDTDDPDDPDDSGHGRCGRP